MGTMVAGTNPDGSTDLYYFDSEGTRLRGDKFCVGSGATYALGALDVVNVNDENLTVEQAADYGRRAIYHATHRDAYSGGRVSVYYIGENGWTKLSRDDV